MLIYTGDIDFTTTPPTFSNVHGYQFSTKASVPNVVGLTQSAAEAALAAAGFNKIKVITEESDTVPEGMVISQSPIYSETAKYSTATIITIVVSEGGALVTPPVIEETTGGSVEGTTAEVIPPAEMTTEAVVTPPSSGGDVSSDTPSAE